MKYIKYVILVIVVLYLSAVANQVSGYPFSIISYYLAQEKEDVDYRVCSNERMCEVGIGEEFLHVYYSKNKPAYQLLGGCWQGKNKVTGGIEVTSKKVGIRYKTDDGGIWGVREYNVLVAGQEEGIAHVSTEMCCGECTETADEIYIGGYRKN